MSQQWGEEGESVDACVGGKTRGPSPPAQDTSSPSAPRMQKGPWRDPSWSRPGRVGEQTCRRCRSGVKPGAGCAWERSFPPLPSLGYSSVPAH